MSVGSIGCGFVGWWSVRSSVSRCGFCPASPGNRRRRFRPPRPPGRGRAPPTVDVQPAKKKPNPESGGWRAVRREWGSGAMFVGGSRADKNVVSIRDTEIDDQDRAEGPPRRSKRPDEDGRQGGDATSSPADSFVASLAPPRSVTRSSLAHGSRTTVRDAARHRGRCRGGRRARASDPWERANARGACSRLRARAPGWGGVRSHRPGGRTACSRSIGSSRTVVTVSRRAPTTVSDSTRQCTTVPAEVRVGRIRATRPG